MHWLKTHAIFLGSAHDDGLFADEREPIPADNTILAWKRLRGEREPVRVLLSISPIPCVASGAPLPKRSE